jgi:hypothetical protein
MLVWSAMFGILLAPITTLAQDLENEQRQWFVDAAGEKRAFHPTHQRLNSPVGPPRPARMLIESALGLGLGTTWYFLDQKTNRPDWDNPEFRERLSGDAWRFDNNSFSINFIGHPLTGSGFYLLARTNNLGPGWSFANSFGYSLLWELGIEFKEKVSINDQIVTPIAGVTIGEFVYRAGRWLNGVSQPTALQHALRYSLALGESSHRVWDGIPPSAYGPTDRFGYDTDLWHRFEFSYALAVSAAAQNLQPVHRYRFNGEFAAMPGYHAQGQANRWFYQLEFSRLEVESSASTLGSGVRLDSEVILAGHYAHRYHPQKRRRLDGLSSVLGLGIAYGYRSSQARGWDERYAPTSFPGPATKLWFAEGDFRAELSGRLNMDFAGVSALGYSTWQELDPDLRAKTVLRKQGYFYGFGPSTQWHFAASLRDLQLFGSILATSIHSTEGLDRSQEELVFDERAHSTILEWGWGARLRFPTTPLVAHLEYQGARWTSWVEGVTAEARAKQFELGLTVLF